MNLVFELDTEVAKCDYEPETTEGLRYAEPDYATLSARTEASLMSKHVLRIEQYCYLRRGDEMPDQPWIKPRILLEPAIESEKQIRELAQRLHEEFVESARRQLPENLVAH